MDGAPSFDYESDACRSPEVGSCTFQGAVANLAVTAVGAGMLSLPKAYSTVGFALGLSLTLLVSVLTYFSSAVIIKYCAREQLSYGGLVQKEFGCVGSGFLQASIIVHVFGVMVVYLIIISDMLVGSAPTWTGLLPYLLGLTEVPWWLCRWSVSGALVAAVVTPMLATRDLSTVSKYSRFSVGMLLLLAATLVCLAGVAVGEGRAADVHVLPQPSSMKGGGVLGVLSTVLTVLAVSALAFTCQFNLVPVHNSLADNRTAAMLCATRYAIALCAALYASMAIAGYTLFGSATDGDVLKNLSVRFVTHLVGRHAAEALILFIVAATTGNLLVNFVLKVWAVRDAVCELTMGITARDLEAHGYYLLTAGLVVAAYGVSVVVPSVWFLVALVGSTACVTFSYVFPGLLLVRKSRGVAGRALGGGAVALAAVIAIVGIYNALTGDAEV